MLWSDEDECFIATLPEWQNARTHGATLEEAAKNARQVLEMLIASAQRHGERIPPAARRLSGNLRLRLPVSLHGRLARGRTGRREPESVDREQARGVDDPARAVR